MRQIIIGIVFGGLWLALSITPAAADQISKGASLDLQGKCAKQARVEFNRQESQEPKEKDSPDFDEYTNHYNEAMNKCFILFMQHSGVWDIQTLSDAYERKIYGQYMWHVVSGKKYWENPPTSCSVTLPSAEEKTCNSKEEFYNLIAPYMPRPEP
jgi:hypothetical protein